MKIEMGPLMVAKGVNGQLELLPNRIRIKRKGVRAFLSHGLKGEKEIFISQISSIQFKKAGALFNGYIQFSFLGGTESKKGIFDATQDENTVMFTAKQQPIFETIKQEIERMVTSNTASSSSSELNELEKLASLRDRGIITEDEFNTKKRQILGI